MAAVKYTPMFQKEPTRNGGYVKAWACYPDTDGKIINVWLGRWHNAENAQRAFDRYVAEQELNENLNSLIFRIQQSRYFGKTEHLPDPDDKYAMLSWAVKFALFNDDLIDDYVECSS